MENLLFATLILGLASFFKYSPPKKKNLFWGYRTFSSRKTEESWLLAQKVSGRYFFMFSIILFCLCVIMEFILKIDSQKIFIRGLRLRFDYYNNYNRTFAKCLEK